MSTLVTRGEEVKLKCNYNVLHVRGGEEHRKVVFRVPLFYAEFSPFGCLRPPIHIFLL